VKLGTQLFIIVFLLVLGCGGALTVFFVRLHNDALTTASKQKIDMVRESVTEKAKTLALNGAVTSARSAVEMDFELLQNVMITTAAGHKDIVFAMIVDSERHIVVHTDKAKVGQVLDQAAAAPDKGKEVTTQEIVGPDGKPVLEAAAPIFVGEERWGAVYYGISLAEVAQIVAASEQQRKDAARRGAIYSLAVAAGFLVIALFAAMLSARRVVRPVARLEEAVQQILAGRQNVRVNVSSPPDVAKLAGGFNAMVDSIDRRKELLRNDRRRAENLLEEANQAAETKLVFLTRVSQGLLQPLDRITKVQEAVMRSFKQSTIFVCAKCGAQFEADEGDVSQQPCPSCRNGALKAQARVQIAGDAQNLVRSLKEIESHGEGLKGLVGELMSFSVLDTGAASLESVELSEVIAAARSSLSALAAERKLAWPDRAPAVTLEGNRPRLEQAVMLAVELVCQLSRQPDVVVRLEVDECTYNGAPGVQLVVRDSGAGLASDYIAALKKGTSPDVRATLSLMGLRRITSLHNGEMSIESEAGRGVTVRVVLPRRQPAKAA
jgi:signal transduction histidine kinase